MASESFADRVRHHERAEADSVAKAALWASPAPPDDDLLALFASFAQAMPDERAVDIVAEKLEPTSVTHRTGLFRKTTVEGTTTTLSVVDRGWFVGGSSTTVTVETGLYDQSETWRVGLAVTVQAEPLVALRRPDGRLQLTTTERFPNMVELGPLHGPSMAEALLARLNRRPADMRSYGLPTRRVQYEGSATVFQVPEGDSAEYVVSWMTDILARVAAGADYYVG